MSPSSDHHNSTRRSAFSSCFTGQREGSTSSGSPGRVWMPGRKQPSDFSNFSRVPSGWDHHKPHPSYLKTEKTTYVNTPPGSSRDLTLPNSKPSDTSNLVTLRPNEQMTRYYDKDGPAPRSDYGSFVPRGLNKPGTDQRSYSVSGSDGTSFSQRIASVHNASTVNQVSLKLITKHALWATLMLRATPHIPPPGNLPKAAFPGRLQKVATKPRISPTCDSTRLTSSCPVCMDVANSESVVMLLRLPTVREDVGVYFDRVISLPRSASP